MKERDALPKIRDVERPVAWGFWESRTLEELAELQKAGPIKDIRELFGTWPDEADDGFEEAIDRLRRSKAG